MKGVTIEPAADLPPEGEWPTRSQLATAPLALQDLVGSRPGWPPRLWRERLLYMARVASPHAQRQAQLFRDAADWLGRHLAAQE